MTRMRRLLALLLALMLTAGCALAEGEVAEPETFEEVGEIELPGEVAAPEAPAEAPMSAPEPMDAPTEEATAPEAPAEVAEPDPVPEPEPAPVAFIGSLTLGVKEQFQLNGKEVAGGLAVRYESSKPKVASVDESGVVVARRAGSAAVTCYQGDTLLGTCNVTVLKAPKKLAFPNKNKSIVISKDQALNYPVTVPKGCGGTITYASDNPAVMTVDAAGNLLGISGGTATLTATAYNGKSARCTVRVLGGPAPTVVTLNETQVNLPVKGTSQLVASFDEGKDAVLTWTTSNKRIVTVSENGLMTAKKAGTATITCTTHNGLQAACGVLVYTAPKKVTLNVSKLTLKPNDAYQLVATLTKNSVSDLTWSSDNPGVAVVDANGLVIAAGIGKANVTVQTTNGKKATCKVTVQDPNAAPTPGQGNVLFVEDTPTLKVKIVKDHNIILAYVWAENPNEQLFKYYYSGKTRDIMEHAVAANGLQDKLVLGFNASPPINESLGKSWNRNPLYHHKEPLSLMITNGQLLVNKPTDIYKGAYIYWVDAAGNLCAMERPMDEYTTDELKTVYQGIIDSGTRNTFLWKPVLIRDHQAVPFTKGFLWRTRGAQKKHALCQLDDKTFLIVTSLNNGRMTYPRFQEFLMGLGVKTALELDAGTSSSFMYKAKNSNRFYVFSGGRPNTSMLYFTE